MSEPTRYFGGSSVHTGRVRRLSADTFKELVESQVFVPVAFTMKRHEFLKHPERDKLKDGAFLTCATYGEDECQRGNANATGFTMVILDIDGPEAAGFTNSPQTIRTALSGLNFVAWTTAKHQPLEPRLKIAVDCLTSDAALHKRTVLHAISLLGLPPSFKGLPESLVLSQPQYRPLHFVGEDYAAVIASRLDGKPLEPASLPDISDAPQDETGGYAYVPQKQAEIDLSQMFFNLPITNIDIDRARELLFAISPDCTYQEWYEVAAALRHNYRDEDTARQAFDLYDEWSATGSKYKSREECYTKWKSFAPYPEGRNPITMRTLIHHAMKAGWKPDAYIELTIKEFQEWSQSVEGEELLREGIRRIASIPIRSDSTDEIMADHILQRLKGSGMKVSKIAILKDVKLCRRQERMDATTAEKPAWMMPFCFIGPQDRFRNVVTGTEYPVEAFNHTFGRFMTSKEDAAEGKVPIAPSTYALNIMDMKTVEGTLYDPREKAGSEPYFTREGKEYVNTFLSSSVPKPCPVGARRSGRLIRKLLSENLGNEKYERIVLDFLAFIIQKPGVKIRWAIFLQGGQGCGKGTLLDTVKASIGIANFKVVTGSALTGDFNEWREGAMAVYIDELFSAGSNRHEVNNKLKDAISNTTIPVNRKFKDLTNVPNVTNYVVTSNKHDALVLEDSDRRYFVLKSRLQTRRQIEAFAATGVMEKIHATIEGNPGSFRQFFLDWEISKDFNPNGHAPETIYRHELIDQGKNPLLIQIEDMIEDETFPLAGRDLVHYAQLERDTALLARNAARPSHYLHTLGYRALDDGKMYVVNGERTRIYAHCERFIEGLDCPVELLEERISDEI